MKTKQSTLALIADHALLPLLLALSALCWYTLGTARYYPDSAASLLAASTKVLVIAAGCAIVTASGGIDVSIAGQISLSLTTMALASSLGAHPALVVLCGAAVGAVCGALVPAAAAGVVGGMMNAAGFGAMFVGLHRLIFTNSNWLLNPATDILIRMMPQALFETALRDVLGQFALAFALAVLLLAAAYAVVSGMVKRQLTQTEERP